MLLDEHIKYDESILATEQLRRIKHILGSSKSGVELCINGYGIPELIHRTCWHFGVSPLWLLVSLQRERSILGKLADSDDLNIACGVTNQDEPGMANPLWSGLATQIFMCAKSAAWLGGIGSDDAFGYRDGLWPSAPRWPRFRMVDLKEPQMSHVCGTMAEYVQLSYTPHYPVLEANSKILNEQILPLWCLNEKH
jgi:hypothetical protein